MSHAPLPRVLLVDDEPHVLDGLRRMLRHDFEIDTATGPTAGLDHIRQNAAYAVVLSDFQMPQLNGAQFLAAVRQLSPDTSRILLTGQADLAGAAAVVNEGGIMRMLLKPAGRDEVVAALQAGVESHRLVTAERDLLDNTLRGSIRALTEVLSLANPTAFERSTRVRSLVAGLASAAGAELPWHVEIAAMLSDLGAIAIPPEVLQRAERGMALSEDEQRMIDRMPDVADQILAGIPRIEEVRAAILGHADDDRSASSAASPFGGAAVRLARDFDALVSRGADEVSALSTLRDTGRDYDPALLDALADVVAGDGRREPRAVSVDQLVPGMVLVNDIVTLTGMRLVTKGHQLTTSLIARVRNYAAIDSGVAEPIHVFVTASAPAEAQLV